MIGLLYLDGWSRCVSRGHHSGGGDESCIRGDFGEVEFRCIDDYRGMFRICNVPYMYGSLVEGYFRKWFMDVAFLTDV